MGEVACGLAVEFYDFFYAECGKELRDDNTADGVDGVDGYGEVGVGDSFAVDEGQGEHGFDVSAVVGGIGAYGAEVVDGRECVFAFGGDAEHFFTFGVVEEFTARVEEFKGVPLYGVVGCGEDKSAVGPFGSDGDFGCGC